MRCNVVLDLLAGDARGIERVAGFVAGVGEEGFVALEQIVATAVDEKVVVDLLLGRATTIRERLVDAQTFRIALAPEGALEILSGLDQFAHHSYFARRKASGRERHLHG